jgi:hypothetical protein
MKSKSQILEEPKVKHGVMARIHAQLNNRLMEIDEVLNQNEESAASRKPLLEILAKLGAPPSKEIMDLRDRVHTLLPFFLPSLLLSFFLPSFLPSGFPSYSS